MSHIPDSDSETDDEDNELNPRTLTVAAQNISEGSIIYLQMMKTFSIMFFILTIVNLPLYMMY